MAKTPTNDQVVLDADTLHQTATTAELLIRALEREPHAPALTIGTSTISRLELAHRISQYAQEFAAHGMTPGTAVALLATSIADALCAQFAAQMQGARLTLLSASSSDEDLAFILDDAGITHLIVDAAAFGARISQMTWSGRGACTILAIGPTAHAATAWGAIDATAAAAQRPSAPLRFAGRGAEGISSIAYTGGTTGRPKGVIGTFESASALTQIQLAEWEWPDRPRMLLCTPLTHAGGAFVLPALLRGGHVFVMPSFDAAAVLHAIETHRITATFMVPTMLYALLDSPALAHADTSSLQTVFYGAAPASPARVAQAIDHFGPIFFQFYGQTECGMTMSVLRRDEHRADTLATCGRPVPWLDVTLRDDEGGAVPAGAVGEICVRGPLVSRGYWQRAEQTAETYRDGWLHTGDMGRFDEAGYLSIVDRAKDVIISGGFNVYSAEVESVIADEETVAEVAVVGVAHEYWGEAVTALIVATVGREPDTAAITQRVRDRRGAIHAPKQIFTVAHLPRTALGKIDKAAARRLAVSLAATAADDVAVSTPGAHSLSQGGPDAGN